MAVVVVAGRSPVAAVPELAALGLSLQMRGHGGGVGASLACKGLPAKRG